MLGLFVVQFSHAVIVKGVLTNADLGTRARIYYYSNPFEAKEVGEETVTDSEGKFSLALQSEQPQLITIEIGIFSTTAFARSMDTIIIHADLYNFNGSISYLGTNAADNNYLADEFRTGFINRSVYPATAMEKYILREKTDSVEIQNEYFFQSNDTAVFTKEFRNYMRTELQYRYLKSKVANGDTALLSSLNLHDQEAIQNNSYQVLLRKYLDVFVKDSTRLSGRSDEPSATGNAIRKKCEYIVNHFSGRILNYLLTYEMHFHIGDFLNDRDFGKRMMSYYKKHCSNAEYISFVEEAFKKSFRIEPGQPAPSLNFTEENGRRTSLEQYRGKYVLVFVWATWCSTCLADLKEIQGMLGDVRFSKLQIVFVNYRDNYEQWKKYIRNNSLKGINVYADIRESMKLEEDYELNDIPHYILIDPKGRIVSANYPWQGEGTLLEKIK
jgi:cytochrome oxidase Cu insertion factor (SCO1/SenC/PrrC family)